MRTKLVKRYYCGYCNKSNCSASTMAVHERHCTMNPNRICRMCRLVDQEQPSLADLRAVLPSREEYVADEDQYSESFSIDVLNEGLRELRKVTECPACILATLRQHGIPVPAVSEFDYTEEVRAFWDTLNEREREEEQRQLYADWAASACER